MWKISAIARCTMTVVPNNVMNCFKVIKQENIKYFEENKLLINYNKNVGELY